MAAGHCCKCSKSISCNDLTLMLQFVSTTSIDGTVSVWDARDGKSIACFTGHSDMVLSHKAFYGVLPGVDEDDAEATATSAHGTAANMGIHIWSCSDDHTVKRFFHAVE